MSSEFRQCVDFFGLCETQIVSFGVTARDEVKSISVKGLEMEKYKEEIRLTNRHIHIENKLPRIDKTRDMKVPAGHMIVGVRILRNPDIMSDKGTPISGFIIMKKPKELTDAEIFGF